MLSGKWNDSEITIVNGLSRVQSKVVFVSGLVGTSYKVILEPAYPFEKKILMTSTSIGTCLLSFGKKNGIPFSLSPYTSSPPTVLLPYPGENAVTNHRLRKKKCLFKTFRGESKMAA